MGALVGAGLDRTKPRDQPDKAKAWRQLPPNTILAQDANNHDIPYHTITSIDLKNPGFLSDAEIQVKTPRHTYTWVMDTNKEEFASVITLFQQILPDKTRIK